MIGIINYGMGNLRSVQKAFQRLDADATVLTDPAQVRTVDKLVLPGVGAFADGMAQLEQGGWPDAIHGFLDTARPFLGICLGMQLLFESSQEDAPDPDQPVPGLGVLPGQVVRFQERPAPDTRLKVPHMGWNTIRWQRNDPLLDRIDPGSAVYFVHSYYVLPTDSPETLTSATSDYGQAFCASIWHQHVWATQFHPEKSQRVGLQLLANFARM